MSLCVVKLSLCCACFFFKQKTAYEMRISDWSSDVCSSDLVRSATKEQIQSLGAKPIFVEDVKGIEGEGSGGYAGEMSDEYKKAQAELVSSHIAKQDIVITTALIPGRPAPRLISDAQLATMKPGSVIVDLAVEQGGTVEGAVAGPGMEGGRER